MLTYTLRRLGISIPILAGVTLIAYLLINAMPGDPVAMLINPNALDLTSTAAQQQREALGLGNPFLVRYFAWLGQAVHGNIGYSYSTGEPVLPLVLTRLLGTAELVIPALVIALAIALSLGTLAATRRNSAIDYLVSGLGVMSVSIPSFFLALAGIYVFSLKLNLLPAAGRASLGGGGLPDVLAHMVLPVGVLALLTSADLMRYVRSSLLDILGSDFLKTARAKGLSRHRILMRHALRNGLLPLVTAVGARVPELLGGVVITETIFQWPGIGMLSVQAIANRDYAVLMGVLLVSAVVVLVSNLVTDLLYARVDPRVRLGAGRG